MTTPSHVEVLEEFIETMDRLVDDFYRYQDGDTRVPFSVIRDSIVSALTEYQEVRSAIALMRAPVGDARDALQEILLVHANDNHRPQAFYIAAKALAAMQQTTGGGE